MRKSFLPGILLSAMLFLSACSSQTNVSPQPSLADTPVSAAKSEVFQYRDSDNIHGTSGARVVMYMSVCGATNVNKTKTVMDSFAEKGYLQYALREIENEFACPGPANMQEQYSSLKIYIACMQKTTPQSYEQYLVDLLNYFNTHKEEHTEADYQRVLSGFVPGPFTNQVKTCLANKDYISTLQGNINEEKRLNAGRVINGVPVELFPDSPQKPATDDPLYFNSANTVGGIMTEKEGKALLSPYVSFPN